MQVGFLAWNNFQVAHFAPLLAQFDAPDVIFTDRQPSALKDFDPQWLTKYGAYSRFIPEIDLHLLDGQYDAILTQNTPPLAKPWEHTKLIMAQYSLAKPKTAYNGRWLTADAGLVYGPYSEHILDKMCPVISAGNSRFDPFFSNDLDPHVLNRLRSRLNPNKKSVLFLPTWGDLSSGGSFEIALTDLSQHFNVLYKPHHMSQISANKGAIDHNGLINAAELTDVLDIGPYLMELADVVISDMSGAIFDALYCRRPVVLMGLSLDFEQHRKADPTALEIAHTDRIGPVVLDPHRLVDTVNEVLCSPHPYRDVNEALVAETFTQRGNCAPLAAQGLERLIKGPAIHHDLQAYAAPALRPVILGRTYQNAVKRTQKKTAQLNAQRHANKRKSFLKNPIALLNKSEIKSLALNTSRSLPAPVLGQAARVAKRLGFSKGEYYLKERRKEVENGQVQTQLAAPHKFNADDIRAFKKLPRTAVGKRNLLNKLRANGAFFDLGYAIECWATGSAHAGYGTVYQYYCTASNLRFSRDRFHSLRKDLLAVANDRFFRTPTIRRRILRDLGAISKSIVASEALHDDDLTSLQGAADLLGPLVTYLDCASENEGLPLGQQHVRTPEGEWVTLSQATGPIYEMSMLLGFARMTSEESRDNRRAMIEVTRGVINTLHAEGWTVLPRLQAGHAGAVPITGKYPSMTWHTTDTYVPNQLHLKVGAFSDHIILDSRGYSGWSSLADQSLTAMIKDVDFEVAGTHFDYLHESLISAARTKYAQSDDPVPEVGKYIFLPMQVATDTVAKLAYIDGLSLLEMMITWAAQTDYTLIVKRHPKCTVRDVRNALGTAAEAGQIILSNAPIHDLIAGADAIVTVNSGVGAESLLHLKPVITTGASDYAAATVQVKTQDALEAALSSLAKHPVSEDQIKAFLWIFTKEYQLHPDDSQAIENRVKALLPSL